MAATSSQDQAIELSDVTTGDINGAERETLIPADGNGNGADSQESGVTESEERGNLAATAEPQPEEVGGASNDQEAVPEKLQDDDRLAEIWYKKWFFRIFPKLRRVETQRRLRANDDAYNSQFRYVANKVITSRYNIITFLPLNLFEQFLRVANLYFLLLVILQAIPTLSSVNPLSTAFPLIGVLSLTAIKDAYDDIKRHISDWKVNHRIAQVLNPSTMELEDISWQSVRVGSIVRLEKDDFVTADMLLLSSSEPNSLVYIETAELDGETNLKVREPLPVTAGLEEDSEKLSKFRGEVICEPPNNRLHKFVGVLEIKDNKEQSVEGEGTSNQHALDNDKILLRGCRLRNTKWMYGLVIFAGHDTKLVQNSGRTKFKRTHLDRLMNRLVIMILCFLLGCLIVGLVGSLIFEFVYGAPFTIYAAYFNSAQDQPEELAFIQIFSNLIVLNTFVPISLYVSVEAIRLGLSLLINWDRKMYYEPEDVPAIARTTTLNEELGQIEYIFSDKTGTLTQNVMTFLKCSIGGVKYGNVTQEDKVKEQIVATGEVNPVDLEQLVPQEGMKPSSPELQPIDLTEWNKYADPNFVFYDQEMIEKCRNRDPACDEFFTLLSLCHTVLPSMETGTLQYNAQSPDEAALVAAAKNFGYVFKGRSPFTLTVDMLNKGDNSEQNIEVLNILDFNNERKRMSVIVRIDERIVLYCKGADSIVFARLNKESEPLMKTTLSHLADYAREGLRTLVLAKKELTVDEYTAFADEYYEASIRQEDRELAVDHVYEKIEQNLTLMGATAIEDKLQDGVPETIANLAKANIKIWVLTGDKQETAINIGYSCKLLTEEMRVFVVDEDSLEGVKQQLKEYGEIMDECEQRKAESHESPANEGDEQDEYTVDESKLGPPFGIVINGHSLRYGLKEDIKLLLLETASRCKAVICCRVTPLQKKRVVDLVKKNKAAVTLAIGDGANDVGMIKAAHIGVGISGREGQQAVLASDYSFGQFRYLERLLLVHGRWSYHRMTTFLRYFFYKNFAFAFSQFVFAFFCGFTAQTLYDPTFITSYNVIYTSLPVIALAILDQDVDENNCYRYPRLYVAGQQNKNFNTFIFARSLIKGIYVAIILFFVLFGLTFLDFYEDGFEWDYQSFGTAASGGLILIVNLQIALDTFHWNPVMHVFVWGSILSWLVVIPITSAPGLYGLLGFFEYLGVAYEVIASATFWIYLPIAAIIALIPTIIFRTLRVDFDPHIVDDVRLMQKKEGRRLFKRLKFHRKAVDVDVAQRVTVKRTGYAYSHTEGFGDMITTGRIFGREETEVAEERLRRLSTIIGMRPSIKAALAKTAVGVASAVATHGVLQKDSEKKRPEVNVEIHVVERDNVQTKHQMSKPEEEETRPPEKTPSAQVENLTVESVVEGDLSVPDNEAASDHNGSTAMLLPTVINGSSDDEEGRANLTEAAKEEDTEDAPVSINLPGSVESPPGEESARDDGTSDDQKLLIPSEQGSN